MIPAALASRLLSVLLGAGSVFSVLVFLSYDPADLPLFTSSPNSPSHNIGGVVGAWFAFLGRGGFGWTALAFSGLCLLWALQLWKGTMAAKGRWTTRALAALCWLAGLSVFSTLAMGPIDATRQAQAGGMVGYVLARAGRYYLGAVGTGLLAGCVTFLAWVLVSDGTALTASAMTFLTRAGSLLNNGLGWRARAVGVPALSTGVLVEVSAKAAAPRIRSTAVVQKPKVLTNASARPRPAPGGLQLPPLDLLTTPPPPAERQLGEDLQAQARVLEETLKEFGIEARCVNIDRGPTVTRYELSPAPGVKITKIVSLADDLALVLKTASCHVIAPIPGKGLVGVDVPNSTATIVYLKELLASREFQQMASPLALAIGKDVSGEPVVCDLREGPHLLIAGATGSGKTVCLNSLLTGLLYHASPDEVKFLMIDPKMVELVLFNDIPHLVAPVVTDAKRAAGALFWAVQEMERRYQLLAKAGVRNIAGYNQRLEAGQGEPEQARLPYLVIVIDELADLMMVASRDVEETITRLSQLSRAVGIHVILATQRPSVDVITGVIKANFPARIAFQVASKVDSRTILDMNGADKLLGRGDLLFLKPGAPKPIRAQACYLTDGEIERVVAHLKSQRQPIYDAQLLAKQDRPAETLITEKDELYDMAKRLVLNTGQASTSLLQRRLRLGYARAARILDLMEQEGLVGPPQGSRAREVLVDPDAQAAS
ncbi:MAG: DNA translocase FtsK [Candidatus Omnitrophica bacterium]|nr:DNA translocase FtsK [Candidatus Omnitrophota bacterium]